MNVDPSAVAVMAGVTLMLLVAAWALFTNRQPTRLRDVEGSVETMRERVSTIDHDLRNVRQVVPQKVDELTIRMNAVESSLSGLREILVRIERRQEMMVDDQIRRERDGR